MKGLLLALVTGLAVGAVFKMAKLPIPAPSALEGVVGIVGIYLGAQLVDLASKAFFKHG